MKYRPEHTMVIFLVAICYGPEGTWPPYPWIRYCLMEQLFSSAKVVWSGDRGRGRDAGSQR